MRQPTSLLSYEKCVFWISLCVYYYSCRRLLEAAVTAGWYICDHTRTASHVAAQSEVRHLVFVEAVQSA